MYIAKAADEKKKHHTAGVLSIITAYRTNG
jgi:hypothetical protein